MSAKAVIKTNNPAPVASVFAVSLKALSFVKVFSHYSRANDNHY